MHAVRSAWRVSRRRAFFVDLRAGIVASGGCGGNNPFQRAEFVGCFTSQTRFNQSCVYFFCFVAEHSFPLACPKAPPAALPINQCRCSSIKWIKIKTFFNKNSIKQPKQQQNQLKFFLGKIEETKKKTVPKHTKNQETTTFTFTLFPNSD